MTSLSLIILSYNTKNLTSRCLDSLIEQYQNELEATLFEIIVVDNNSSDETISTIKTHYNKSYITLIANKENTGFSKGNNIGATHAKGKYLLFLNSDTVVEDRGLLDMVSYMESNENIGVLGGRLKNENGSNQASAGVFYTLPRVLLLLIGGERKGMLRYSPHEITSVDWVSGAMMMIEKKLFEQVHGFDEHIFMYMEDMELCYRVKKMGKEVVYYPKAVVKHLSHGSSNRSFAIINIYKGLIYFYKKHMNTLQYLVVRMLLVMKAYSVILLGTIMQKPNYTDTYKQALKQL